MAQLIRDSWNIRQVFLCCCPLTIRKVGGCQPYAAPNTLHLPAIPRKTSLGFCQFCDGVLQVPILQGKATARQLIMSVFIVGFPGLDQLPGMTQDIACSCGIPVQQGQIGLCNEKIMDQETIAELLYQVIYFAVVLCRSLEVFDLAV